MQWCAGRSDGGRRAFALSHLMHLKPNSTTPRPPIVRSSLATRRTNAYPIVSSKRMMVVSYGSTSGERVCVFVWA